MPPAIDHNHGGGGQRPSCGEYEVPWSMERRTSVLHAGSLETQQGKIKENSLAQECLV